MEALKIDGGDRKEEVGSVSDEGELVSVCRHTHSPCVPAATSWLILRSLKVCLWVQDLF